jgi:phosphoketolase
MMASADEVSAGEARPLLPDQLTLMNAWWRAANYLSVGQIYLLDNLCCGRGSSQKLNSNIPESLCPVLVAIPVTGT